MLSRQFLMRRCGAGAAASSPRATPPPPPPLAPHQPCRSSRTLLAAPPRAVERDPAPASAEATTSPDELQRALKRAVAAEDYAEAAALKKQLDDALAQDPLVVLQRQLQAAVDEERYQVGGAARAILSQRT
jgi:hypothetical protein